MDPKVSFTAQSVAKQQFRGNLVNNTLIILGIQIEYVQRRERKEVDQFAFSLVSLLDGVRRSNQEKPETTDSLYHQQTFSITFAAVCILMLLNPARAV